MNLIIMRHGEAESFADSDSQRNLTNYGVEQASLAGNILNNLPYQFDVVWVSPYVRARQTADAVLQSLNYRPRVEFSELLTPEGMPAEVADRFINASGHNVLIVSHQPLVSALVGFMDSADVHSGPPLSPASMVHLTADVLLAGCCTVKWAKHAPY